MSIYAVRLAEWYPPGDDMHEPMRVVEYMQCPHCQKKGLHWQTAYGDHSVPWGYGDVWCNKRHHDNYWKKQRRK